LCFFNSRAQSSPPDDFDWKESVVENHTIKSFYNQSILDEIPSNARFWVDIKTISSQTLTNTYAKDGFKIYQSREKIRTQIGEEIFNHGLHKTIRVGSKRYYSLISSPNLYNLDDAYSEDSSQDSIRLNFNNGFNLNELLNNYRDDEEWYSFQKNNREWFSSSLIPVEISINPDDNIIDIYNPSTDINESIQYSEVYPDLWQITKRVVVYSEETIDGICLTKEETTQYEDFEYIINNTSERKVIPNGSMENSDTNKITVDGNIIKIEEGLSDEYNVAIFDLNGILVKSGITSRNEFNFLPPITGIYLVHFYNDKRFFSNKVFINN
jgi:hypothetical protein